MLNSKRNLYRQTLGRTRSVLDLVSSLIGSYKTEKVNIKQCKHNGNGNGKTGYLQLRLGK